MIFKKNIEPTTALGRAHKNITGPTNIYGVRTMQNRQNPKPQKSPGTWNKPEQTGCDFLLSPDCYPESLWGAFDILVSGFYKSYITCVLAKEKSCIGRNINLIPLDFCPRVWVTSERIYLSYLGGGGDERDRKKVTVSETKALFISRPVKSEFFYCPENYLSVLKKITGSPESSSL